MLNFGEVFLSMKAGTYASSLVQQRALTAPQLPDSMSATSSIRRLSGAEARAYLNEPVLPEEPIVLTDVMDGVPAMTRWRTGFFDRYYSDLTVEVQGRMVKLRDQLRFMAHSTEEDPAPYPFNFSLTTDAPELMKDLMPFVSFGRTDRTVHPFLPDFLLGGTTVHELFFGGRGASFPRLHYDMLGMHTQITQVMGDKEFFFYAPDQTPFLYPEKDTPRVSEVDSVFAPDLDRFPLFAQAKATSVMLHEGETIYFPGGWWHVTRIHGPSISYGRAVVNASNWDLMMKENLLRWKTTHPALALPAFAYGKALGGFFRIKEALHARR